MPSSRFATLALCLVCTFAQATDEPPLLDYTQPAASAEQARGVLRARQQAVLASEMAGRILEMPFREGQSFAKGDVLVSFDCRAYQAQLAATRAASRAANEDLANKRQLAALQSAGRFDVAMAEARLEQAQAETRVQEVQAGRCQVRAPFAGQVVQRAARPHESVAAGAPLLEIVDNRSLEIHLLVPSRWVARLSTGAPFTFIPDETGQPLTATLRQVGARIDEASQTLLLIGELPAEAPGLLAGMSGSARFERTP